jgi:Bax protein
VLKANEEVATQRRRLLRIREEIARGHRLDAADRMWLAKMAERYGVEDGGMDALLRRVDIVPVSLALAQSIQESGWGTSRFARKGNALYGQRTWSENIPGLRPRRVEDPDFKVRAYRELGDSVRLYLHNLNTHPAYAGFRERRAVMRAAGKSPDGYLLAATLTRYSEERAAYVEKLRALVRANKLRTLDDAELADGRFVRRVVPHDEIDSVQLAYGSDT